MRLQSLALWIGFASVANAQPAPLLGELREFVKVDYDRTWKSEITATEANSAVVTVMPRASTAATWEQAIHFNFFRESRSPRGTLLEVASGFLKLMSEGCEQFLSKNPSATTVSGVSVVTFSFECRGQRSPNHLRPRDLSYANIMMISGRHHSFMIVHEFESNRFPAVPAALKRQLDQSALAAFRSARLCEPEPGTRFENTKCKPGTEIRLAPAIR